MANPNFLLVAFPSQSHINPALQLASRLLRTGASVTFTTTTSAHRRMTGLQKSDRLTFATYSDGVEEGLKPSTNSLEHLMDETARRCSEALRQLIETSQSKGQNFTCIIYTAVAPWVADVARCYDIPSIVLWIQPATLFEIYYYYLNGYGGNITNESNGPPSPTPLPGLPPLTGRDIPSFLSPGSPFGFLLTLIEKQIQVLKEDRRPRVLVNTFDALELEQLNAIDELELVAIGPLLPSFEGQDSSNASLRGDLFQGSGDYIKWLGTKPAASVIYISFGSISTLLKPQKEEIARGLLSTGRPFLWVIRKGGDHGKQEESEDGLSCEEELRKQGMIVPWCSQVEVLSHPSVGCFVTHCGWNSTLESLVCGVPMVALPLWADQLTNAMLIEDVWRVGVRADGNGGGIVEGGELERCLELVMGGGKRSEGMRGKAEKLKDLAREAAKEGGSADKNLKAFLEEIVSS
ncbi:crocetin glucosyltransferase, chloroplastic-like [Rhodamnia argentea]|uniref:Glycosyltransferase n=1 Tax=Rhodamnia argentea TaxID=178133 RepID=A0A8B8PIG2_9MYRT|nr:crocetin glucosyltransferase, chloroplastic-like [Rhodamnia argentea]